MEKQEVVYRKVNPYNDEDITKLSNMMDKLNNSLKSKAKKLSKSQLDWLKIRMGNVDLLDEICARKENIEYRNKLLKTPDEIAWFCEVGGEIIGYTHVCTYNVKDGERTNDNVGIISDILVDNKFRKPSISFELLIHAIDSLLEAGIDKVSMNVQDDNNNKFLHFALADKILHKYRCERKDGRVTTGYELLISDINQIKNMTARDLAKRALQLRKANQNQSVESVLLYKELRKEM